jgi:hypothetical protein
MEVNCGVRVWTHISDSDIMLNHHLSQEFKMIVRNSEFNHLIKSNVTFQTHFTPTELT